MLLNVNDERQIPQPTAEDVEREIRNLQFDQYIILSRDTELYMQTYYNEDGSWDLEYRAGSADEHYAADGEIQTDTVVSTFQAYIEEDDFENSVLWFKLEMPEHDASAPSPDGSLADLELDEDLDWQTDIDASQTMVELELQGEIYQRVPQGSEESHETEIFSNCEVCNVLPGQLHVLGCEQEECPLCHGYLMECNCLEIATEEDGDEEVV